MKRQKYPAKERIIRVTGIGKRGLKEEWNGYLRTEYEFSMAVCRSLASDIEKFVNEMRENLRRTIVLPGSQTQHPTMC